MSFISELWRLLSPRQRRQFIGLQLLSTVSSFSMLGGIAAVMPFFSVLADPNLINRNQTLTKLYSVFGFSSDRNFVVALAVAFVAMVAISNLISLSSTIAISRFAYATHNSFQVSLYREYLNRSYGFHAGTSASYLQNRIIGETGRSTIGLLQSTLTLVSNLILTTVVAVSVAFINSMVALCVMAALASVYIGIYFYVRRRLAASGLTQSSLNFSRVSLIADSFGAIKELKLLDRQSFLTDKLDRYCRAISIAAVNNLAVAQSPRPLLECLTAAALAGAALAMAPDVAGNSTWLAQFTFLGLAIYRLLPALQQSFVAIVRMSVDRTAFLAIASDLRTARQPQSNYQPTTADPSWLGLPKQAIELRNVSFRYSDDRPRVIDGANCTIPAGSLTAIVGANGSGKTTLVDLMLGLLTPESGTIEIDGRSLNPVTHSAWQSTVAYVPQSVFLVDGSLAENIALGMAPDEIDAAQIEAAVRMSKLDALVAKLPNGLQQRIGAGGQPLSGGERQRVGLARALYRNSSLLVLDEVTGGLDAAGEADLMQLLRSLRGHRTVILVTHGTQNLEQFDAVHELAAGEITLSVCQIC
jgi:ATP-binding cassette, subfamily B, bacterial PglK